MDPSKGYNLRCTLTFGDIYGQILLWMGVIFVSLAAGLALMGASKPIYALVGVGLILVLSLPFLLFAFTTTLLNHIALDPAGSTSPLPTRMVSSARTRAASSGRSNGLTR